MTDVTSSAPLVELRGIGKTYGGGTVALSGADARIREGGFVSLVGPSGCGKSTLLRIVAGLIQPDAGSLLWPATGGARPRDIGFVFQDATLMPWARVDDNVFLPLKLRGLSRKDALPRIMDALGPPLLLMDEPFAALDEFTREKLDDDLLDLWRSQRFTAIFVTHSIYESVYLSERVAVMGERPGRILADIEIDAPFPRGRAFRESRAYGEYCARVSAALREGMPA